jgi:hypothetical protein
MAKKITIEEMEKRAPDLAKGQRARGANGVYKFICRIHGSYRQRFYDHIRGQGCPTCGRARVGKKLRLGFKEAKRRFPDLMPNQRWRGAMAKYNFTCPNGHEYRQIYSSHAHGAGCKECYLAKNNKGGHVDKHGYRMLWLNGKPVREHRHVYEQHYNIKLTRNDTIHHKNGIRTDNRIENLERYPSAHGRGQRMPDLVSWSVALLQQNDAKPLLSRMGYALTQVPRITAALAA